MSKTFTRRFVRVAAFAVALLGAIGHAAAASGYWRFDHYDVKPPQAQLDAVHAGPGRVLEQKVTGAFQAKMAGKGTLTLYFKNDDVDRHVYETRYTYNFGTSSDMSALIPGQVLHFTGDIAMSTNTIALNPGGNGKMSVDNGDYFMAFDANPNGSASGSGDYKVPGGSPDAVMVVHGLAYLANNGALSASLDVFYTWVQGSPPTGHVDNVPPANNGVEDPVSDVAWYVCSYPDPSQTCGDWVFHSDGTIQGIVNGQLVWAGHWTKLGHYTYQYDFNYSGVLLHTWVRFSDPGGSGRATLLMGYPDSGMAAPYRKGQRK